MKTSKDVFLPLSTKIERKLKALTEILEKLAKEASRGVPIVVEGRKDREAIERLGIKGRVVEVKSSRQVVVDVLDEVSGGEVILLVDFDRDGVELAKHIISYLESEGVKVDSTYWREIRALVRRDVKDVEGLPSYLEGLKEKVG